jgi:hypothetical protein
VPDAGPSRGCLPRPLPPPPGRPARRHRIRCHLTASEQEPVQPDTLDSRRRGEFTRVMVRLRTAELDIVDTLIAAGIANNRAEAIRWALTRIPERPAYQQLREHTRDIDRLKSEF